MRSNTNPLLFFFVALAGYQGWVFCDVFAKLGGPTLSAWQVCLFNSVITGGVLLLRAALRQRLSDLRVYDWRPVVTRIICANTFIVLSVVLVQRMNLADYYTVAYLVPLLTALGGALFLGERLTPLLWGAIVLGFVGVLIAVQGDAWLGQAPTAESHPTPLWLWGLALLNAAAMAGGMLCIRWGSLTESTLALGFYVYVVNVLICGGMLLADPSLWRSDLQALGLSVAYGTLNAACVIALLEAYHRAPASIVAPSQYSQFITGALLGWLLFAEIPSNSTWIGAALIVIAGFIITITQQRRGLSK